MVVCRDDVFVVRVILKLLAAVVLLVQSFVVIFVSTAAMSNITTETSTSCKVVRLISPTGSFELRITDARYIDWRTLTLRRRNGL